jgi:hypothetical protein
MTCQTRREPDLSTIARHGFLSYPHNIHFLERKRENPARCKPPFSLDNPHFMPENIFIIIAEEFYVQ